jgi:formylglycine-generating enzyme required for sulfatase activity
MIDPPDHSDSNLSLSGCSAFARFPLSWREARQIQDESALERGRPSRLERSVRGRLIPARPLGWPLGRRTVCTSLTLAWVPPGEFAMGCQSQAGGVGVGPTPGWISEPVHPVLLTEGFYLGVCPVTQEQFTAVNCSWVTGQTPR